MSNEAPRRLAVVRTATDLFDSAARRVAARIAAVMVDEKLSVEAARPVLDAISAEVRARIEEPALGPATPGLRADLLFDPFLDGVLHDLLGRAEDAATALSTLQVIRAVMAMRAGGEERDTDRARLEDLRARLRAPDAFELLIEVAHDFRSPLTSILFLSETLRDGHSGEVSEHQRSQLRLIYSAAFGLASVASDVMDLARREQDLIEDETQPYALGEVFDSVERLVSPIVEEKGLELRVSYPSQTTAHGHPHALSRVLLNLTTNALKFTDEGYVSIGARPLPRSRLEFYVQDTGRGIPANRQAELFRPFKKRLGERQEGHFFSGSGVGLSIARRLVRAMGSELLLETSDETGTRFSFAVPSGPTRRS